MSATEHTLAAIDGAVEDWTTSGDAMRWVPEQGRTSQQTVTSMPPVIHLDVQQFQESMRTLGQHMQEFRRVMANFADKQMAAIRPLAEQGHRAQHEAGRLPTPITRCRICRPRANPPASQLTAAYRHRARRR